MTDNYLDPGVGSDAVYDQWHRAYVLTADNGTDLTGDWTVDRAAFNLAAVLENDGWGNPYEEQMSTRTLLSGGPDADYFTPGDNIPPGIVPDDVVSAGGIEYVDESGRIVGGECTMLVFGITNTSDNPITLTSITLTWDAPVAWYKKVKIVEDVVEQSKHQIRTGDTAIFLSEMWSCNREKWLRSKSSRSAKTSSRAAKKST